MAKITNSHRVFLSFFTIQWTRLQLRVENPCYLSSWSSLIHNTRLLLLAHCSDHPCVGWAAVRSDRLSSPLGCLAPIIGSQSARKWSWRTSRRKAGSKEKMKKTTTSCGRVTGSNPAQATLPVEFHPTNFNISYASVAINQFYHCLYRWSAENCQPKLLNKGWTLKEK